MSLVIITVGTPGLGKSTIGKNISKQLKGKHYTQDDYKNLEDFFEVLKKDSISIEGCITIVDRCNVMQSSRKEIIDIYKDNSNKLPTFVCIDFININNKGQLLKLAMQRIKDRPPEGQQLKFNEENRGYAVKKIIQKKFKQYIPPQMEEGYAKIVNINVWKDQNTIARYVLNQIKQLV